jgi:hypothetical protein
MYRLTLSFPLEFEESDEEGEGLERWTKDHVNKGHAKKSDEDKGDR